MTASHDASVQRLNVLDAAGFAEQFARQGRPLVLTGVVRSWPCFERWTIPYLSATVGKKRFAVTLSRNGAFGIFSSRIADPDIAEVLAFEELLEHLAREPKGSTTRYLQQKSVQRCLPELAGDLGPISVAAGAELRDVNLWCGERGSRIPLHYDSFDNFLAQVRGAKRVRLFHPSQSPLLYAGHDGASFASPIDPDAADLQRHPRFAAARPLADVTLAEGELLFIPAFWWHYVVTESTYSISLNYWYQLVWGQPRSPFMQTRQLLDVTKASLEALPEKQRQLALCHARSILED